MNENFILNPAEIANGSITRSAITEQFTESAKQNGLLPLDKLRFFRETSKAATDAEKLKNADGLTITQLAIAQAKRLPEYKRALKEGKKEFMYNGTSFQLREETSVDMATVASPEEAEVWLAAKAEYDAIEQQIADLRTDQKTFKTAMTAEEEKYLAAHPKCKKTVKQSLVVL